MQYCLALVIIGLLSSLSFAEEGPVYPDSAKVEFHWNVSSDTVIIQIENLSQEIIRDFYFSEFTKTPPILVECRIDDVIVDSLPMDQQYGSVYADRLTTRWIVGDFRNSILLKYYVNIYGGYRFSWSATNSHAMFGTLPPIGPPRNLCWRQ